LAPFGHETRQLRAVHEQPQLLDTVPLELVVTPVAEPGEEPVPPLEGTEVVELALAYP